MSIPFSTDLLDRVRASERTSAEAARLDTLRVLEEALRSAPALPAEVILFGSLIESGMFSFESDVDVAVSALSPVDYFALKRHLEHAVLRDVDLVDLDTCHFADRVRRKGNRWTARN